MEPCECQQRQEIEIYHACIVPNHMYKLQPCWLNQAELRRLDAFCYKCMRRILKIPHSYANRVTNHHDKVYSKSIRLNMQLFKDQMRLYGNINLLHADHVSRKSMLNADSPIQFSMQCKRLRGTAKAQ